MKTNIQYLNNLLGPHASMAKVTTTLVRFTKPNQVAYFLDSCSWPTGPEAVPVKTALLSWVKFVQDGTSLDLATSVRERYLKDIVPQVLGQQCSCKEWEAKAIALSGRLASRSDLAEPDFHCKAVNSQSTMIHELMTFVLAVQHLATLKLLLSSAKEDLTCLGAVDNWATSLVQGLVAEAGATLSPKKSSGGSAVPALPVVVPAASASGVWQQVFVKMEYKGPKDAFVPWPAMVMAVTAFFNGLARPLDSSSTISTSPASTWWWTRPPGGHECGGAPPPRTRWGSGCPALCGSVPRTRPGPSGPYHTPGPRWPSCGTTATARSGARSRPRLLLRQCRAGTGGGHGRTMTGSRPGC